MLRISTHAPRTGSDILHAFQCCHQRYFNPRSPHGERRDCSVRFGMQSNFNPRSPHGERLHGHGWGWAGFDFNPRSPHGERQPVSITHWMPYPISTHAPRTGSDRAASRSAFSSSNFNPRSPHGERRLPLVCFCTIVLISTHAPRTGSDASSAMSTRLLARFQPTLPARGATRAPGCTMRRSDFNPRSPHGERQRFSLPEITGKSISTHAPRTGSDTTGAYLPQVVIGFQPTLPARGAT